MINVNGSFVIGRTYKILTYVAGDDFTNIGGTNVSGNVFVATGTSATTWFFGSVLQDASIINGISSGCEFYNTSVVGGVLAIDNPAPVSVKFTSGSSSSRAPMGANITLT
jgi:hypothetical protein